MGSPLRIIVTGMVGQIPVGGVAWDYLQYVIGLARLGHDVVYHEDTRTWPYHPIRRQWVDDPTYSARYLGAFFSRYAPDLSERWHYLHLHQQSCGMPRPHFEAFARSADVFLNVSGACIIPDALSASCLKVFLDTDPGYNQILLVEKLAWSKNVERWCASVAAHDRHFTYAENIHGPDCRIPHAGFRWQTTRMPIPLELWEGIASSQPPANAPWTTVMTWNAFKGRLIHRGIEYGSKGMELEKILPLPQRVNLPFTVAIGGHGAPLERVAAAGWNVVDGPSASVTPEQYQELIARSRGEVSPAKNVYVATRSGWFSCRTACYLAAGRPAITQDTGFKTVLPTGAGLFAFDPLDDVLAALDAINSDYDRHRRAAREIAEEHFRAETVLARLLTDLGI
jgi:hypothetical protein